MSPRLRIGLAVVICAALSLGGAMPAASQQQENPVFHPPLRELVQRIRHAEQAAQRGQFAEAAAQLGELLSDPAVEDYFVEAEAESDSYISLKAQARRILGEMPAAGRAAYELQFGARAKLMLDEAVEEGNLRKLSDVTRMHFHTQAGYQATMLLGRHHLDRGWPSAAARCFALLLESPVADQFEPQLSLLAAAAWHYASVPDRAAAALRRLQETRPGAQLAVGGRSIPLPKASENLNDWLLRIMGEPLASSALEESRWVMFRGNAARNAQSSGGLPLLSPRWKAPTVNDPHDEETVRQIRQRLIDQGLPAIPSVHPLVVGDVILTRTPTQLIAVDFQTGKRVWPYPWDLSASEGAAGQTGRGAAGAAASRERQLEQRLCEDSPYGQLSSDGKLVFMLHGLGFVPPGAGSTRNFIGMAGRAFANPDWPSSHNELVALDLAQQGKLRWIVGGETGESEPKLAGAFFLGPPLPLQGWLYALAEIKGEIRLVVLDAANGQLVWSQQLALVQDNQTIVEDGMRRLAGATPSFAEGVLVCPTSAGAVVGVDISTRSLLWGFEYKPAQTSRRGRSTFNPYGVQPIPVGQRWLDSSVTVADGRVLATPVESDRIFCLDLSTGRKIWDQPRGDLLYVACVHQGAAALVGLRQESGGAPQIRVATMQLANGRSAWSEDLTVAESAPSGRGFYFEGAYCLPTTDRRLITVDLDSGTIAGEAQTDEALGNLICYQDHVISQDATVLKAFYQIEPLRKKVEQTLAAKPDDPWALARRGELRLQSGEREAALADLRRSYEIDPNDATRMMLSRTLLAALEENFDAHYKTALEMEPLLEEPQHKAEYLRIMTVSWQKKGEAAKAFRACLDLADLKRRQSESLSEQSADLEQVEPNLRVRRDRWVQSQLAELAEMADDAGRAELDAIVRRRWEAVEKGGAAGALRDFIAYFGFHPLADKARLRLASLLIEGGEELLEAQLLLSGLQQRESADLAAPATALLARLWEKAGLHQEAAETYRELAKRWPDEAVLEGKTGRELVEALAAKSPVRAAMDRKLQWPTGRVKVESQGGGALGFYDRDYPVELRQIVGPAPRDFSVAFEPNRRALRVRDRFGQTLANVDLTQADTLGRGFSVAGSNYYGYLHAKANGRILLASLGSEILAINLLGADESKDAILWRQSLILNDSSVNSMNLRAIQTINPWEHPRPRVYAAELNGRRVGEIGSISNRGVCFQRMHEIVCVDPLDGRIIWSRSNMPAGADLFGDDEVLLVVKPRSGPVAADQTQEAIVLRMADGKRLEDRAVPIDQRRWTTRGRNVLTWKELGAELSLSMVDPWEQRTIWGQTYKAGSKGCLIGDDELAILQPDGKLQILNLANGKPRLEAQIEPQKTALMGVHVIRSSDQYLVAASGTQRAGDSAFERQAMSGLPHMPQVSGHLHAFDRATGKPLWQTPAVVENYSFPLEQSAEVPIVALFQQVTPRTGGGIGPTRHTVLCLDRRDGRVLLEADDLNSPIYTYSLASDIEKKTATLQVSGKTFQFTFTDEPAPPSPPAQTGSASSVGAAAALAQAGAAARGDASRRRDLGLPQQRGNFFLPALQRDLERLRQLEGR